MSSSTTTGLSGRLILLFAITAGASVGNLYWSQPLLALIAQSFGMPTHETGLVVTFTQVGYALGVFLIVPLGDVLNRQRLMPSVLLLTAVMLVASGLAPNFWSLLVVSLLLGICTVGGQIITPLAGDLAADHQRGKVLGLVVSGLVLGILIARALSGIIADFLGWHSVFFIAALLMVILAFLLSRALPPLPPKETLSYGALLRSVIELPMSDARIPRCMFLGALPMGTFMLFWTGLTFLLSEAPYSYSAGQIGLIGLLSVSGVLVSLGIGILYDKGLARPTILVGILLTLLSMGASGIWYSSIWVIGLVIVVFSIGMQVTLVLVQTCMLSINPVARSRLNTLFGVSNFIVGAMGSGAAGLFWGWRGWSGLAIIGVILLTLTIVVWFIDGKSQHQIR